jgi:hypothetical protein
VGFVSGCTVQGLKGVVGFSFFGEGFIVFRVLKFVGLGGGNPQVGLLPGSEAASPLPMKNQLNKQAQEQYFAAYDLFVLMGKARSSSQRTMKKTLALTDYFWTAANLNNDSTITEDEFSLLRQVTLNIQRSTFNVQHSTFNIQHSTSNIQHSTFNIQHSTFNVRHSISTFNI